MRFYCEISYDNTNVNQNAIQSINCNLRDDEVYKSFFINYIITFSYFRMGDVVAKFMNKC